MSTSLPHARRLALGVALAGVAAAWSCSGKAARVDAPPIGRGVAGEVRAETEAARTAHLVILSIDGLRPEAIRAFRAPMIDRLAREGASSLDARTILPSVTLPSHVSMLTGVEPGQHGITWNNDRADEGVELRVPSVFALAQEAGLHTAAFFGKGKLRVLARAAGASDHVEVPARGLDVPAERIALDVARYLRSGARPNLLFIHLGDIDRAGHEDGWMTPAYGTVVEATDFVVEALVQSADSAFGRGQYTLILTADHGGHSRTHGSADVRDARIPWIAWGKATRGERVLPSGIRTTDTAATALWLLGVPVPAWMTGRPVSAAFEPAAVRAAGQSPTPSPNRP